VDSDYTLYTGQVITAVAGYTYTDVQGTIRVIYDTTQCNGGNYWCIAADGSHTWEMNPALLIHELSHAYYMATGTLAASPEPQAIADENNYRAEVNLPLRNPNNSTGGCGTAPNYNDFWDYFPSCYIASAAAGSPLARDVNRLRQLRDIVVRGSRIGRWFFGHFFDEYYRFSPRIADDMLASPEYRAWVTDLCVAPLMFFFDAVAQRWGSSAADDGTHALESATPAPLFAGRRIAPFATLAERFKGIRTALEGRERLADAALPLVPNQLNLDDFFSHLETTCQRLATPSSVYAAWALIEPIEIVWRSLAEGDLDFELYVDQWLGRAPIPSELRALCAAEAHRDVSDLCDSVLRNPVSRATYLARLGGAEPTPSS
jgi:hypothetical protein